MPKIPVYEARATTGALPTPTIRPAGDTGLAQLGHGIQQVAGAAADIYMKEKKEAEDARLSEAVLQAGEAISQENATYRSKKAKDAMTFEPHVQNVDKAIEEVGSTLPSDSMRQRFQQLMGPRRASAIDGWRMYAARETLVHYKELGNTAVKAGLDGAMRATTPEEAEKALSTAITLGATTDPETGETRETPGAYVLGMRKEGLSEDTIQQNVKTYRAMGYAGAIEAQLSKPDGAVDAEQVEKFIAAGEADLDKTQVEKYRATLENIKVSQQADAAALDLVTKARDPNRNNWVNMDAANKAWEAMPSGPLKNKTKVLLEQYKHNAAVEVQQMKNEYYDRIMTAYSKDEQFNWNDISTADLDWLQQYDNERYLHILQLKRNIAAEREAKVKRAAGKTVKPIETPEQINNYSNLLVDINTYPERYSGMTAQQVSNATRPHLSEEQHKNFMTKDYPKAMKALRQSGLMGSKEFTDAVTAAADKRGLAGDERLRFQVSMYNARDTWNERNSYPPTAEEFQKYFVDPALQTVLEKGAMWGTNQKKYYEVKTEKGKEIVGYVDENGNEVMAPPTAPGDYSRPLPPAPLMQQRANVRTRIQQLKAMPGMTRAKIIERLKAEGYPTNEGN